MGDVYQFTAGQPVQPFLRAKRTASDAMSPSPSRTPLGSLRNFSKVSVRAGVREGWASTKKLPLSFFHVGAAVAFTDAQQGGYPNSGIVDQEAQ